MSEDVQYAWLLWGRRVGGFRCSMPLGCYATREIALKAEEAHKAHPNAALFEDIRVVPWPIATEVRIHLRMKMAHL